MKKFQITNPCNKYNLESKGDGINFNCLECQKNVKNLSDSDVNFLAENIGKEVNTCVKITKQQLFNINSLANASKVAALTSVIAIASTSCSKNIVFNQGDYRGKIVSNKKVKEVVSNQIRGKIVVYYSNEPLIGGPVKIKGTTIKVITDIDGNFVLEVPPDIAEDVMITFTYPGFLSIDVELKKIIGKEILVYMGEDPGLIGYLECIEY